MNPDWTFPTQPDYLEPDVNQGTIYPRFLEEPDAMNAMLWDGPLVPSIDPCLDSEDVMGLGADSNMDFGCVCDFPPLYCNQHGTYGGVSMVDDPPASDLQQIPASLDNVLETVEHVPGPLELTEKNLTSQSISQGTFERAHKLCTNDQGISIYVHGALPTPNEELIGRRLRRSKISYENRHILRAHFSTKRYPSPREIDELQERTGLDKKCIKAWFSNSRHRAAHNGSPVHSAPPESKERSVSETPSHASTSVSAESLRKLDRLSPACSTTSLERYLATPLAEEAIPSTAMNLLLDTGSTILARNTILERVRQLRRQLMAKRGKQTKADIRAQIAELKEMERAAIKLRRLKDEEIMRQSTAEARTLRAHQPIFGVAGSVAGSDSSRDSGDSAGSWISQNSVDSRGPRRGRKSWVQIPNQFNATASTPDTTGKSSATTKNPKGRLWYCTWPSCDKSFQFRSEWDRHETTLHHCPYHWVCNLDQETDTVHKDAASRIFYREDQLLVHMRGSHPGIKVTKLSVATLKQDNPDFNPESLKCGFCHETLRNWEERQNHVAAHIKGGLLQERLPKSSWLVTQG